MKTNERIIISEIKYFLVLKSKIVILVLNKSGLNQSPISAVFPIVRFTGDQKTALTWGSLYFMYG